MTPDDLAMKDAPPGPYRYTPATALPEAKWRASTMTPAEIQALTPEARTQLFERLATAHYGKSYDKHLCADFDITARTPQNWRAKHTVPRPVIYALDAWVNSPGGSERVLDLWEEVPEELAKTAKSLGKLAAIFERLARART